jgi:predicted secreted protein
MKASRKSPKISADAKSALDRLSWLAQAIGESPRLCRWLCDLEQKSFAERRNQILLMTAQMSGKNEDAQLTASFALLADQEIFNAMLLALREARKIKNKSAAVS